MSSREPYNPVVIGGGIAGLVRALALADRGRRPVVIDSNFSGGLIQSVAKEGFTLECGATTLVDTPEIRALLKRLSLEDRMLFPKIPKYRQYLWYKGAPCAVPRGPIQALTSPLLPGMEKFKVVRGLLQKGRAAALPKTASVDALFSAVLSPHIAANLVAPVLRGIFGGDTRRLVASAVFPKLWECLRAGGSLAGYAKAKSALGKRAVFRIAGGNSLITSGLLDLLKDKATLTRAGVTGLAFDSGSGLFTVRLSTGETLQTDSVSVATAGSATADYVGALSPELKEQLLMLRYAPIAVVHLKIDPDAPLLPEGFGVLFPETPTGLLGILFNSLLFPAICPPGQGLVTVCMGGVGREDLVGQPESELGEKARAALKEHLGIAVSEVLHCARWAKGIPQYEERIVQIHDLMAAAEQKYPGISFIGADRGGVGVPARIETALNLLP